MDRMLLSGDEAVARAAARAGVALGTGYPGTPSTEILEAFAEIPGAGKAQWAPNEKVALEVGLGAAFAGVRALVTMKHVGLNVAADPLFTAAYTGVAGGLVIVTADDPGLASSQNEQDNRRYAVAAGLPMLEPADSQEAYDFTLAAFEVSERWHIPVLLRLTTRVCHSKTIVQPGRPIDPPAPASFVRDIKGRVMIPAHARQAHRKLRAKLADIAAWNERNQELRIADCGLRIERTIAPTDKSEIRNPKSEIGIIASGIAYVHAREAVLGLRVEDASASAGQSEIRNPKSEIMVSFLNLGMTHPLPIELIREFAASVDRCVVIEEGDPYLVEAIRAAGIDVLGKPEMFRFGELNVNRVRRILANDTSAEPAPPPGKPPQLCMGCPHRTVFDILHKLDCIVSGDIGCYTLGVLPPYEAMDTCVCMGASVTVGLGLRHVLPRDEAKRVVSVIRLLII